MNIERENKRDPLIAVADLTLNNQILREASEALLPADPVPVLAGLT